MKTYAVKISNAAGQLLSWMEWKRYRFTKREYDFIIQEMYYWTEQGIDYLFADVFEGDPETLDQLPIISHSEEDFEHLFCITSYTKRVVLTPYIKSYFFIKGELVRMMKHSRW